MGEFTYWIEFSILVVFLLALDLLVFNKKEHEIKIKEALLWSAFWIFLGLAFGVFVYYIKGTESALEYFSAYFIEKSLSVDNLFVFLMIFTYFKVPGKYQHRTLFWGIIGALVMRFIFIFAGVKLIEAFDWILYIFGLMLIYSGYKIVKEKDKELHPEKNPIIKAFKKIMPVTSNFVEGSFFTRIDKRLFATPLFIVLLVIESSDIMFAIDSIPAVLAISQDMFIIYTSNIMAILGLRALYFALAVVMKYFKYLNYGLSIILVFVGIKMMLQHFYHIPVELSLLFVGLTLAVTMIISVIATKKEMKNN